MKLLALAVCAVALSAAAAEPYSCATGESPPACYVRVSSEALAACKWAAMRVAPDALEGCLGPARPAVEAHYDEAASALSANPRALERLRDHRAAWLAAVRSLPGTSTSRAEATEARIAELGERLLLER